MKHKCVPCEIEGRNKVAEEYVEGMMMCKYHRKLKLELDAREDSQEED